MSDETFTLSEVMPLIEVALMRSGGLIDLDRIIDELDPVERIMIMAKVLIKNAKNDPVISKVLARVNVMEILKAEAMHRREVKNKKLLEEAE